TLSACATPSQQARLIVSSKRISDPFQLVAVDQYAVETAVAIRLAGQVVACGEHDAPPLVRRDARCGATEIGAAALPDLDEDQGLAVAANQVDLAAADAEIALDQAQAAAFEMTCRQRLGFAAARGGGIVGLCSPHQKNDRRIRCIVCRPDAARKHGRPYPARRGNPAQRA